MQVEPKNHNQYASKYMFRTSCSKRYFYTKKMSLIRYMRRISFSVYASSILPQEWILPHRSIDIVNQQTGVIQLVSSSEISRAKNVLDGHETRANNHTCHRGIRIFPQDTFHLRYYRNWHTSYLTYRKWSSFHQ